MIPVTWRQVRCNVCLYCPWLAYPSSAGSVYRSAPDREDYPCAANQWVPANLLSYRKALPNGRCRRGVLSPPVLRLVVARLRLVRTGSPPGTGTAWGLGAVLVHQALSRSAAMPPPESCAPPQRPFLLVGACWSMQAGTGSMTLTAVGMLTAAGAMELGRRPPCQVSITKLS